MAATITPADLNLGTVGVGGQRSAIATVNGATFTQGEIRIDGQDCASFSGANENAQDIRVTFAPATSGAKIARLVVLIESDGQPYYIYAGLSGTAT